ncbi:two-component system nitrate/nitrite response regulator NarL [Bradyrhizobium japonicum]
MRRIRIVIADRHPIVLQGVRSVLAAQRDFAVVASCSDGASCVEAIRFLAPDVALVDAALPDFNRQQMLARANAVGPRAPIIFFTGITADSELQRLALNGACIVLSKDSDAEMLVATLRKTAQGQAAASPSNGHVSEAPLASVKPLTQLTDRERQIMRLVSEWAIEQGDWASVESRRRYDQGPPSSYLPEAGNQQSYGSRGIGDLAKRAAYSAR